MIRTGKCSCGKVRYELSGEPSRVGICHCTLCRRETGSVLMAFAVWPQSAFETQGETKSYEGRSFCPECGSRLFSLGDDEVEIKVGTLDDAPTGLTPHYELWIRRREPWLVPVIGTEQHDKDRP